MHALASQLCTFLPLTRWAARAERNNPSRGVLCTKASVLTTGVLNGFPLFECGFDRQKIFMFAVVGMLLDGCASPSKSPTTCGTNGIFCENLSQCIRKLKIKCRNVSAANHAITPTPMQRCCRFTGCVC